MPTYQYKPVELVEVPPDGTQRAETINAPTTSDFYIGQVVKIVSGNATAIAGTETTGFYVVVRDNSPRPPEGSFVDKGIPGWLAEKPATINAMSVSGKRAVITAKGTLAAANIGASFGLTQVGEFTALDLANTTTAAATILAAVEGRPGDTNPRVLVRFN